MTLRRLDWSETRLQQTDWTGQAEVMAITPSLDRESRGRAFTHAGEDRLRKDIDTRAGQDRLARQVEAGYLHMMERTG